MHRTITFGALLLLHRGGSRQTYPFYVAISSLSVAMGGGGDIHGYCLKAMRGYESSKTNSHNGSLAVSRG